MQWQDISTAPKDGTPLLGFWQNDEPLNAHGQNYGVCRCVDGDWVSVDDVDESYNRPTHWMPLPPPPSEKG